MKYCFEVVFNESTLPSNKDRCFEFEVLAVSADAAKSAAYRAADERWGSVPGYEPGRVCITQFEAE